MSSLTAIDQDETGDKIAQKPTTKIKKKKKFSRAEISYRLMGTCLSLVRGENAVPWKTMLAFDLSGPLGTKSSEYCLRVGG